MRKPSKDHRTERRTREIRETFCARKGCRFFGQHAQQGVCFSRETFAGSSDWSYVDAAFRVGAGALKEMRALQLPGKVNNRNGGMRAYVGHLEAAYASHWTSEAFHLDEMIRSRREVAILRSKVKALPLKSKKKAAR